MGDKGMVEKASRCSFASHEELGELALCDNLRWHQIYLSGQ